ncbi:restriction endonuclease subunit S [Glaesserella parasuis]|nr:restriction endonuclease subunit S [Glaesserella parasuis]
MSSWKKYKLGELLELVIDHRGKTPKKLGFDDFHSNGYPVLSAKHVKTSGLVNLDVMRFANQEMYEKWMKIPTKKGDIVLTSEAPLGELFYIDGSTQYLLGQRVFGLRTKSSLINPMYLFAWLSSPEGQSALQARATGSTVQGIKQSELLNIELSIPNLIEQEKVAEILFNLNKKIQLNTQINQTLEQIAQTIFKSWFIDFDPVHAKAEALANGQTLEQATQAAMAVISGKNTQELHRLQTANPEQYQQLWEIAEAFPRGVDEEGVPRGWEMTVVKSVCEKIQNGGTPKRSNKEYWNNGNIPWLSSGEVCNNNILISSKEFITQFGLENSSTKLIEANSTLVALYASPTAGKCSFCVFKATTNQAVCALVPKEIYKYFNFYYLQTKEEYYSNQAVGSAQQNISKGIVEDTPILKPDSTILGYFNLIVVELMNKQISNLKESDYLKNIRDVLLPKLLSGEV